MSALLFREPFFGESFVREEVWMEISRTHLLVHTLTEWITQLIHSIFYKCVIQTVWVNFKWKEQWTLLQSLPSEMWNQVYYFIVHCSFSSEVPEYRSHQKTALWKEKQTNNIIVVHTASVLHYKSSEAIQYHPSSMLSLYYISKRSIMLCE